MPGTENIGMAAATYDITIEQGATWTLSMIYRGPNNTDGSPGTAIDVTGCTAALQVRASAGGTVLLSCDETDGITVGNTNGHIDIVATEVKTMALTGKKGKYDLYITFPGGAPTRKLLVGNVTIVPTITNPTTA